MSLLATSTNYTVNGVDYFLETKNNLEYNDKLYKIYVLKKINYIKKNFGSYLKVNFTYFKIKN